MCTTFSCSVRCSNRCSNRQNYVATSSYYCESAGSGLLTGVAAAVLASFLLLAAGCSGSEDDASDTLSDSGAAPQAQTTRPPSSASSREAQQSATSAGRSSGLKILVFGDSISAAYGIKRDDGWVALLTDRIQGLYQDAQVINASVSGETTQGGRARLAAALDRHKPDVVFLELGGNDALRGYPVSQLRDNLGVMVELAQTQGARVVLLGMQIPPNYGPKYTREFAAAFKTVADAKEAYLVPFFLEGVALIEGMIQSDGIHPTTQAQPLLLETGWKALVETMGETYPLLRSP